MFRASFPHLWGDELTPSDCRDSSAARGDEIFKTLSACLIRKDNRYHDSHGHRGRFKKREWWRDLADRRRDWKQSRGVLGEWSYQPNESRVTIYAAPADYYFDEEADLQRSDIMVGTHFAWMHNYTRLCHSSINRELLHIWSNSENKH
jgi:hypothetical protein